MSRTSHAALVVLVSFLLASAASAVPEVPGPARTARQGHALVELDPIGAPILVISAHLDAGKHYEIQTDDLKDLPLTITRADTVMALRDGVLANAQTLAGADVCNTPGTPAELWKSCVRYYVSPSVYPSGLDAAIWVWAHDGSRLGTTDVRLQEMASASASPSNSSWTVISNDRTFGGLVVANLGPGAGGPIQLETTKMPNSGTSPFHHLLLIPGGAYDTNVNWLLSSLSHGYDTHRRDIERTAEWTGDGASAGLTPTSAVLAGNVLVSSPLRVIRNDGVEAGHDVDGDELGRDLEFILATCDSVDSPDSNGLSCSDRPGCDNPSSALCLASLRDSDGDGLRDDHEIYGVSVNGRSASTELPRYGADPAHYDLFVELDYAGTSSGMSTCTIDPSDKFDEAGLAAIGRIYRRIEGFDNRDGLNGIFMHIDAGVPPTDDAETAYGDWGGSNARCGQDTMSPAREGLFRYFHTGGDGTGFYVRSGTGSWSGALAHEIGHSGGLDHDGPVSSHLGEMNGAPNYWSRINYLYDYVGITPGVGGAVTVDTPKLDLVSFSTGRNGHRSLNPRSLDEQCPFGVGTDLSLMGLSSIDYPSLACQSAPGTAKCWTPSGFASSATLGMRVAPNDELPGCWAVDWDRDGVFAPFGERVDAPLLGRDTRVARHTDNLCTLGTRAGGDMSIGGDHLYRVAVQYVPPDVKQLYVWVNDGITCDECGATTGGELFPPCWSPNGEDVRMTLSGPGGQPVSPRSVAIQGYELADGSPAAVVVYVEHQTLYYGRLLGTGNAWYADGEVPGANRVTGLNDRGHPDLTLLGGDLLLTYNDVNSDLVIQRGTIDAAGAIAWQDPVPVTIPGWHPGQAPWSSPGITTVRWPTLGRRAVLALQNPNGLGLYTTIPGRALGEFFEWVPSVVNSDATNVKGRPSLAQVTYGSSTRLTAVWLGLDSIPYYAQSGRGDVEVWTGGDNRYGANGPFHFDVMSPYAPTVVFDDRPNVSHPGLRMVHTRRFRTTKDDCSEIEPRECRSFNIGDATDCPITGSGSLRYIQDAAGELLPHREYLEPFADGVFVGRTLDFDDRPALRHGFCRALRSCNTAACRALIPHDSALGAQVCEPEPTYNAACVFQDEDLDNDGVIDEDDACPSEPATIDWDADGCQDQLVDLIDVAREYYVGDYVDWLDLIEDQIAAHVFDRLTGVSGIMLGNGAGAEGAVDLMANGEYGDAGDAVQLALYHLTLAAQAGAATLEQQLYLVRWYRDGLGVLLDVDSSTSEYLDRALEYLALGDAQLEAGDLIAAVFSYSNAGLAVEASDREANGEDLTSSTLADIIDVLETLVDTGALSPQRAKQLVGIVERVEHRIRTGNDCKAVDELDGFVTRVESFVARGDLSQSHAGALLGLAEQAVTSIGKRSPQCGAGCARVSIDARALSATRLITKGGAFDTAQLKQLDAIPGSYTLRYDAGVQLGVVGFQITDLGTIDYDKRLEGALRGADTCSLVVRGVDIALDVEALTIDEVNFRGIDAAVLTEPGARSFTVLPGLQRIQYDAGPSNALVEFSVRDDGRVTYDDGVGSILAGKNTSQLQVLGAAIGLDSRLSSPDLQLNHVANDLSSPPVPVVRLLPGLHRLSYRAGPGSPLVDFDVTMDATVRYDASLEGILTGAETSRLVIHGAPIGLDATALTVSTLNVRAIDSALDVTQPTTLHLLPGPHRLGYDAGPLNAVADFEVTSLGHVQYDGALEGVLTGADSRSLVVQGATIQIDAAALSAPIIELRNVADIASAGGVQSVVLLPGSHLLRYDSGQGTASAAFDVGADGLLALPSPSALLGAGAQLLTIVGTTIHVQLASGVGNYTLPGLGTFAPAATRTFTFLPGQHSFRSASRNFEFIAEVGSTVSHDPAEPGVTGNGTDTLSVSP